MACPCVGGKQKFNTSYAVQHVYWKVKQTHRGRIPASYVYSGKWMTWCNEMRGVNYRQMASKAANKDLVPVRWNDVR